jgi:hypothetical protein
MRMHNNNVRGKPRMKMGGRPRPPMHDGVGSYNHQSSSIQDKQDKIDSRCRHNSQYLRQFVDKYLNFARESISSGDRIAAEGFFQHADHYQRLLNEKIQERAMLEKTQRDMMEAQVESRTVHSIDAESSAISPAPSRKPKKPAADQLASVAGDVDTKEQLSEQTA